MIKMGFLLAGTIDTCLILNSEATLPHIIYCALRLPAGSDLLLGLVMLVIFAYGMYRFNMPMIATMPLAIVMLYFFGFGEWALDAVFTNLFWLLLFFVGGIAALAIYKMAGRN